MTLTRKRKSTLTLSGQRHYGLLDYLTDLYKLF